MLCGQSVLPGNSQQSPQVVSPRAVCFPPCCHANTRCVVGWWLCPTSAPNSSALLAFRVRDSWPPFAASWWLSIEGSWSWCRPACSAVGARVLADPPQVGFGCFWCCGSTLACGIQAC